MTTPITSALPPLGDEIWYATGTGGAHWELYTLTEYKHKYTPMVAIQKETGEVLACVGGGKSLLFGITVPTIEQAQMMVIQDTIENRMS